jgi:DNA-directed RNA polymerase subunit RPC12/RpoP
MCLMPVIHGYLLVKLFGQTFWSNLVVLAARRARWVYFIKSVRIWPPCNLMPAVHGQIFWSNILVKFCSSSRPSCTMDLFHQIFSMAPVHSRFIYMAATACSAMQPNSCNYCSYGIAQKERAPSKKNLGQKVDPSKTDKRIVCHVGGRTEIRRLPCPSPGSQRIGTIGRLFGQRGQ